eukprot:5840695-Amphidinium_carterae.1
MAEAQVQDMLRLHKTMSTLRDSCKRISTFAGNLVDVEKNMLEAHRIADSTVGPVSYTHLTLPTILLV